MTSAINPNNIDGAYPVAGQDNDSQGFRDNFTNIKTNFTYARDEITALQLNTVKKNTNNDMGNNQIFNVQLRDVSETVVNQGASSGTVNLNYDAGSYYRISTQGPVSLGFSNWPGNALGTLKLEATVANLSHTITLPGAVGAGTSFESTRYIIGLSGNVISFSETGTYVFEFRSTDGGSSVFIEDLVRTPLKQGNLVANNASITNNLVANSATIIDISGNVANFIGTVSGNSFSGNSLVLGNSVFASVTGNVISANTTTLVATNITTIGAFSRTLSLDKEGPISSGNLSAEVTTSLLSGNVNLGISNFGDNQIKILINNGNAPVGVSVVNAGWLSSGNGTANLSAYAGGTFQYVGNRWCCIGNNGITFT